MNVTYYNEHGNVVSEDTYIHTYEKAGTYKAVLIASNVGQNGDEIKQVKEELSITVSEIIK